MTRLAFDLDGWEDRDYRGEAPLTEAAIAARRGHVPQRPAVGLPAARRHARPAPDASASYYDFIDVDTDRYQHRRRRSARSCCRPASSPSSRTRSATGWVNQRIIYTHGIGVAMVPVNEVATEGQPRLFIRNLPPVSIDRRARRSREPRIYFGERPSRLRRRRRPAGRVRLPDRRGRATGGGTATDDALDGTTGIQLDTTLVAAAVRAPLPRPRPADQRPGHGRQPAAVPPLARRPAAADRAVPALRQGPVPRHRRRRAGSSTSRTPTRRRDRFPHAQAFDPGDCSARPGLGGDAVQLHPQQRQDHDGRLRRDDELLRRRPGRPAHPRLGRASSRRCSSR